MNMQKEWSSFILTLIPYLVLLILPFSFYFVYTSFKTMQQDTKIVRQSSWIAGAVGHITHKNDQHTIQNIDKTLQRISIWGDTNNDTKLYIGAHTLLEDLEKRLKASENQVACIIITPVGHPTAKDVVEPPKGYLEGVRALADAHGAVLIFDEVRTGFRVALGGAGEYYGVVPDMATFGKAMANGYPISALVGKKEVMEMLDKKVFVSSTFFPNSLEMAASLKCIEIIQRDQVIENIWKKGENFLAGLREIQVKYEAPITVSGIPPMPFITFNKVDEDYKARRTEFYTQTIRKGLFIQPYHHWYICYRHTEADMAKALRTIDEAMAYVMEKYPVTKR